MGNQNGSRDIQLPLPAPSWARSYRPGRFRPFGYAADVVGLSLTEDRDQLNVLVVTRGEEGPFPGREAHPGGFVEWLEDQNGREAAIRELREETGLNEPEYIETLDTYDDMGRDPRQFVGFMREGRDGARVISKAHMLLFTHTPTPQGGGDAAGAQWSDVYQYLPWENHRNPEGEALAEDIEERLRNWAQYQGGEELLRRINYAFGTEAGTWNEERCGERFRLLDEAGMTEESQRNLWGELDDGDNNFVGQALAFDHRQMLADGLGRLRGKVKYRPFTLKALVGESFTLTELQEAVEAIGGRKLHKSNFRRTVAKSDDFRIVEGTGQQISDGRPGRNPEVFEFIEGVAHVRLDPSIRMPWERG